MRALANVEGGVVKAEIEIDAPPERVFHSLTDPSELAAWWGSDDMYRTYDWRIDLREGGSWSVQTRARDGTEMPVHGIYLEIDPPHRLVYTWCPSWDDFVETTIRVELQPRAGGTRMLVTHSGFGDRATAAEGTGEGWKRVLEWLGEYVATRTL